MPQLWIEMHGWSGRMRNLTIVAGISDKGPSPVLAYLFGCFMLGRIFHYNTKIIILVLF